MSCERKGLRALKRISTFSYNVERVSSETYHIYRIRWYSYRIIYWLSWKIWSRLEILHFFFYSIPQISKEILLCKYYYPTNRGIAFTRIGLIQIQTAVLIFESSRIKFDRPPPRNFTDGAVALKDFGTWPNSRLFPGSSFDVGGGQEEGLRRGSVRRRRRFRKRGTRITDDWIGLARDLSIRYHLVSGEARL